MQKRILAITTITTLATLALANAQSATNTQNMMHDNRDNKNGMHKMMGKKMGHRMARVDVIKLILAGNYADFQAQASTTPFAKIDLATFSSLNTQMNAEKTAREAIVTILKNSGLKLSMFRGMEIGK